MISFLRRLRINSANSGFTQKYLLYAVGEIVLVMLGILLALQVNNWNEARNAAKIEYQYLIGLQEEFTTNLVSLDQNIAVNKSVVEAALKFFDYTGPNITALDDEEMAGMTSVLLQNSVEYEPSPGILEDLISSGNLNKLTNLTLRKQLSNWKAKLARAHRQENNVLAYRSNIKDLMIERGNLRRILSQYIEIDAGNFTHRNTEILEDPRLENNLSFFIMSSQSLGGSYYQTLRAVNEDILDTIKDQME